MQITQKELALRAQIAKSKADLATVKIENPDGPKGAVAITGETPVESVVLAYQAMRKLAEWTSAAVSRSVPEGSSIFILNPDDFKMLSAHRAFIEQLALISGDLDAFSKEAKKVLKAKKEKPPRKTGEMSCWGGAAALTASAAIHSGDPAG